MTAALIRIERARRGSWYDEYRRLRHAIFVSEQGWQGLSAESGLTPADPADAHAWFWLARDRAGALIGVVRVVATRPVFPHEELFAHHLAEPAVTAMRARLGSLNSLAVDAGWRRRSCIDDRGRMGTAAALLLQRCIVDCPETGIGAMVATAQTIVSVRALMRVGFHVIDAPARTHLHPTFVMCNVGVVLELADRDAVALAGYFRRREQQVLGALIEGPGLMAPVGAAAAR